MTQLHRSPAAAPGSGSAAFKPQTCKSSGSLPSLSNAAAVREWPAVGVGVSNEAQPEREDIKSELRSVPHLSDFV
ncbi:hypothetical protein VZT92_018418 [Zoarces viviparus]|uniref:Uncharacterized protein n=1 Tax=Zoarces viviparus TaxID=48416 RepID=A0AAW1EHB1_ZOAVI